MIFLRQTACFLALAFLFIQGVVGESTVHTVFTTECGAYFTWQSMGKMMRLVIRLRTKRTLQ